MDEQKSRANQARHGVPFTEAVTVFADARALTIYDEEHSHDEDRFKTIGMSQTTRILLVVHCDRDEVIRLISARKASAAERQLYESENP